MIMSRDVTVLWIRGAIFFYSLIHDAHRGVLPVPFTGKFSENDALNPELVGVVWQPSLHTGFSYSTFPTIEPHELELFTLPINIDLLAAKELVDDLIKGEIIFFLSLSSVDFSSSDGSIDSFFMPSTPKAKYIFMDIFVKLSFLNGSIDDIDSGIQLP